MASPATHLPVNPSSRAQAARLTEIEQSHANLVSRIASLRVPAMRGIADGEDMRRLSDYLIELAYAVDAHVAEVGDEIQSQTMHCVDLRLFNRPLLQALEGNALHEISEAADALDADMGDVA